MEENKSPEKYDLSFSFDFNVNEVESSHSSDSETTGLEIAVSEVENYDSSNEKIKRKATVQDASVLNEMEEEIERQLDAKAAKSNLTATNVKNILKHVISNEHVMAMVQRRLNRNTGDDGIVFEPKLTRSKAKELGVLGQPNIPWPTTPVKSASAEVQVLIEEELPDDSSDEEYKPEQDDDKDEDDEKETDYSLGSDLDSQPSTPATPVDHSLSQELKKCADILYDSEGVFKVPEIPQFQTEEESIGQRTRSKLCLSETPLEYIEQAFIPPDITTDMYDQACEIDEEWKDFLQGFTQPLTQEVNVEDDPEADPEYNILEEDEAELLDKEEFRMDRAVKVSRKEVNNLMDELLEYANEYAITHPTEKVVESQETPKKRRCNDFVETTPVVGVNPLNTSVELLTVLSESDLPILVNEEQRQLLAVQMRQHVQLMTQQFLMCYKHPDHHNLSKTCKSNLDSVRYLSSGPHSAFNAENIYEALKLVADFEDLFKEEEFCEEYMNFLSQEIKHGQEVTSNRRIYCYKFHPKLKKLIIESKALSYGNLLPHVFTNPKIDYKKCRSFFTSEENLVALGLEQFEPMVLDKKKEVHKYQTYLLHDIVSLIHTWLMPMRDRQNIFSCIQKYKKKLKDSTVHGPIKHFYLTGEAPKTIHMISLDFQLTAPKNQLLKSLPEVWQEYIKEIGPPNPIFENNLHSQKFASYNAAFQPGNHLLNPIINMMPKISLPKRKYSRRKATPKAAAMVQINPLPTLDQSDVANAQVDMNLQMEIPEIDNQRLPQLRKTTARLAKTRSAQNIKSMTHVVTGKDVTPGAIKTKNKASESPKSSSEPSTSFDKGDNEDEMAELMLASTTIKKNAMCRKKAKQTRELENIKRLIDSENELNADERATKFAASYLQKLHSTLESSDPETFKTVIKLFLEYSEKLDNIIQTENENEMKTDEGKSDSAEKRLKANDLKMTKDIVAVNFYQEVCDKLENYPDMCSDFLMFLNSQQAGMVNKSIEWIMLQKMQEFVQVAQVYFAKQPSRLTKVMQSISQLATTPNTILKNVYDAVNPLLKGSPIVMDLFLQVFPMGKPPESLFAPQLFENITCPVGPHDKSKTFAIDAPDLYENIELPVSTSQDDPYGGENCKCNCHEAADSRLKSGNEHCASCGTRFLNGRIYLQTTEGLRPAKITFPGENDEKLENIARVSLKPAEKFVLAQPQQKRRRKSSKNDCALEEASAKQASAFKVSPVKEAAEDGGEKLSAKSKRGPRSPPKAAQSFTSGLKKTTLICKSKRDERAKKRDAIQEKKTQSGFNDSFESGLNKSQNLEEVQEQSFSARMDISLEEDDKHVCLDKINESSDSENSMHAELEEPVEIRPWSRQEDAILLQSIKKEYSERSFLTISESLENRTVQQVKDRCQMLLALLEKIS